MLAGDGPAAEALLAGGADPNACTGVYPKEWGFALRFEPVPLIVAATLAGRADMVALLLRHGAAPDACGWQERSYQTHDDTYRVGGTTALGYAAALGHLEIVRVLLDAGADVEAPDGDGRSPLRLAVDAGQAGTAALLRRRLNSGPRGARRSRRSRAGPASTG